MTQDKWEESFNRNTEKTPLVSITSVQSLGDSEKKKIKTPKTYHRRWLILVIQSIQAFFASYYQTYFVSITSSVLSYYRMKSVDGWKISLTATVYLFMNFPFSCLAAYVLKKKGLRFSMFIGSIFAFLGAWLRFAGFRSGEEMYFWIGFSGYVVGAVSPPFIVNTSTLLSKRWFPAKQRTIATTISSFCNILGTGAAFGVAAGLAGDATYNNTLGMIELIGLQAIVASVLLIITVIFFHDKPPTPPYLVDQENPEEETSFLHDIKQLLTNFQFILLLGSFSFGVGSVNCFLTELNSIIIPQGYSVNDCAYMGLSIVGAGLFGACVFGVIADITKRYKLVLLCAGIPGVSAYIWFSVNNIAQKDEAHFIMAMVAICLCGFFCVPLVPILLEYGTEITWPVSESFSSSLMFGCATLASAIFVFIAEALKQTAVDPRTKKEYVVSMQNSMWFCMSCLIFSVACAVCLKSKYKRLEHEKSLRDLNQAIN